MVRSSDEFLVSKHSMSDDDHHSVIANLAEVRPYEIQPLHSESNLQSEAVSIASSNNRLSRTKTSQSQLSRVLTGIKDDQLQDEENKSQYRERGEAEFIFVDELEKATTHKSRFGEELKENLDATGEYGARFSSTEEEKTKGRKKRNDGQIGQIGQAGEEEVEDDEEKDEGEIVTEKSDYRVDGGFAWLMAVCAMLALFSTWGANAAFGVFLNFYLNNGTFPEATEYDYALIGGIVVCLANILSPFSALLYKVFGFKVVCFIGIVFQTAGWILASFSKRIWHLYLTQGVLVGISFSLIFIPATLVLPTWFRTRKAASMGTCVAGAGLGGLVFSLSLNKVIQETGDQKWALRMVGLVALTTASFSALLMRPRAYNPPSLKERLSAASIKNHIRVIFDIKVFKNLGICFVSLWFAIALLGYTLMLFSLSSYATSVGLNHSQASTLTAIMNAAQVVGRPSMGLIADRVGRANFTGSCSLVICILLYAFWINATSYGALIAFSVIIGLMIGVGSSLAQPLAADSLEGELEKLPAGWSGINIFVSFFCLVAEVIALALVQKTASKPYLHTQIFAGTCFFACFLVILPLREYLVRKVLTDRYELAKNRLKVVENGGGFVDKNRYLKAQEKGDDIEENEEEILLERIERYEQLLSTSSRAYFIRLAYPIKV